MSKSAPRNCGIRKCSLRGRLKKNLLADLLAIDIVQEIEILLGRQAVADLDFEALEVAVRQQVLQRAGQAVEQRLRADLSDQASTRVRCACGKEAHFAGRRAKQVHSVLGPLRLERTYYHCSACGHVVAVARAAAQNPVQEWPFLRFRGAQDREDPGG